MKRLSSGNKSHNRSRFVLEVYSTLLYDDCQRMGNRMRIFTGSGLIVVLATFIAIQTLYASNLDADNEDSVVYKLGSICVESPWSFESLGKNVGAVFLAISAQEGFSDRLISAHSPQSMRVEIHDILIKSGIMVMEEAEAEKLMFNSDSSLELKQHGLHVMLMGLQNPLTPESELQLALEFEKSGTIEMEVAVRELSDTPIQYSLVCE